jgi:hypothetical protein
MEDEVDRTKSCAASILNNLSSSDFQSCVKCAELETQLHRALDELSSAQLIVQLLKKEHVQEDCAASLTQHMEADSEVHTSWIEVILKGIKKKN